MNTWLYLIPLLSALLGWFFNWLALQFFFAKLLPAKQSEIADKIGSAAGSGLFSLAELEAKITDGEGLKKILPSIELHIDEFLRHKLGKAMPVISMFIGDKTINQLKEIFMKELEELFPEVIKSYFGHLQEEIDLKQLVTNKIAAIPPDKLKTIIKEAIPREIYLFKIYGAIAGLIIGLFQTGLIMIVS